MPDIMQQELAELLAKRKHNIYEVRERQMAINLLGYHGGRPYIDNRLTRFPAESSIAWDGAESKREENRFNNSVVRVGRKQRAYLVNNCARIATKIRQYVFQTPPVREGADGDFVRDANRKGQSINDVMGKICDYYTLHGWAWLGIDAPKIHDPVTGCPIRPTMQQVKEQKLRLYWNAIPATAVVDWCADDTGKLTWLLTDEETYTNVSARLPAQQKRMRRLWEPGMVTEVTYCIDLNTGEATKAQISAEIPIDFDEVPFIMAGAPSKLPWWFDDVEGINRAIMDLESANDEAYFKSVYPQLVMPKSLIDDLIGQTESGEDLARKVEAIVGLSSAIVENPDDKGITRFVMPPAQTMGVIQDEITRKRDVLYETVGMALRLNTRMAESAEAKAWSNLDAQAVLREKAQILQEVEERAVAMSKRWDASFIEYQPVYASAFDISNLNEDVKALVSMGAVDMPDRLKKLHLRAMFRALTRFTGVKVDEAEADEILEQIETMEFMEPVLPMAGLPPAVEE